MVLFERVYYEERFKVYCTRGVQMTVFDAIAYVYTLLQRQSNYKDILQHYRYCSRQEKQKLYEQISFLGSMFSCNIINDKNMLLFKTTVSKQFVGENCIGLVRLLEYLDSLLDTYCLEHFLSKEGCIISQNNIEKEFVSVFPRVTSQVCWTHPYEEFSLDINLWLTHVFLIRSEQFKGMTLVNHYITVDNHNTFWIAASPITREAQLKLEHDQNSKEPVYFTPQIQCENFSKLEDKILFDICKAESEGCSLIVFPELLSTEELNRKIVDRLDKMSFRNLVLVALPTYYDKSEKANVGEVYSVKRRDIICSQNKSYPYSFLMDEIRMVEQLNCNKELHLLHIPYIGILAFPICRDALEQEYIDICKAAKVNLAVIRSFALRGETYFDRLCSSFISFACSWVWINSCCSVIDFAPSTTPREIYKSAISARDVPRENWICNNECADCFHIFKWIGRDSLCEVQI